MSKTSMKPVAHNERRIANIHTAEFKSWQLDDNCDSGQSVLQLDDTRSLGVGFHVFKMAPGTTTEAHEHADDEEFLLLSGDLTDNDGTEYREGDLVWMKKGTQHTSHTKGGCVLAVYIAAAEYPV